MKIPLAGMESKNMGAQRKASGSLRATDALSSPPLNPGKGEKGRGTNLEWLAASGGVGGLRRRVEQDGWGWERGKSGRGPKPCFQQKGHDPPGLTMLDPDDFHPGSTIHKTLLSSLLSLGQFYQQTIHTHIQSYQSEQNTVRTMKGNFHILLYNIFHHRKSFNNF